MSEIVTVFRVTWRNGEQELAITTTGGSHGGMFGMLSRTLAIEPMTHDLYEACWRAGQVILVCVITHEYTSGTNHGQSWFIAEDGTQFRARLCGHTERWIDTPPTRTAFGINEE